MSDVPYPKSMRRFPTVRQSLLSTFDSCSLSSKFETEYRRGWATHPQARGSLLHRVFGECLREMLRQREHTIPTDAALAILHDLLRQQDVDASCPECGTEEIKDGVSRRGRRNCVNGHWFETGLLNVPLASVKDAVWITAKWAHDNMFEIENIVDIEKRLSVVTSYSVDGVSVERELTGALDVLFVEGLVAEHAIVIDWKDTWALPAKHGPGYGQPGDASYDDVISFTGYFQQRFYAWLIFRTYPSVQRVTLREFYVRYSQTREASITRADLDRLEQEFSGLVERFDRFHEYQTFPPTPGTHCNYCLRPSACPIPRYAREEGRITSPEQAKRTQRQLIVADRVQKQARATLRAYVDVHGPVPIQDRKGPREFGFVYVERTKRPDLEDIRQLEREKGRPLTSGEIARLYRTRGSTRFTSYVPKPEEPLDEGELQRQLEESIEEARAAREQKEDLPSNVVPFRKQQSA